MYLFVGNLGLNEHIKAGVRTRFSTQEHIKTLLLHPIDRSCGPTKTDVCNLMLSAGTWTTAKMNPNLIFVVRAQLLKLTHHANHAILCFPDR